MPQNECIPSHIWVLCLANGSGDGGAGAGAVVVERLVITDFSLYS